MFLYFSEFSSWAIDFRCLSIFLATGYSLLLFLLCWLLSGIFPLLGILAHRSITLMIVIRWNSMRAHFTFLNYVWQPGELASCSPLLLPTLSSTNTNSNGNLSVVLQFFIHLFSSVSELLFLIVIIVNQHFHCDLHS